MRCLSLALVIVTLCSCQPEKTASTKRSTPPPAASVTAAESPSFGDARPVIQDEPARVAVKSLEWKLVPTTRLAFHENIWLETHRTPADAVRLVVADALHQLGGAANPAALLPAVMPKLPAVAWQARHPDVPLRVVMDLELVLTRGYLEHLLSRSQAGKDHESILSAPFDAEQLKAALIGIGLKPGKPATFTKMVDGERIYDFKPATGDVVKVYVQYEDEQGKTISLPAQEWIAGKDGKILQGDWVFAGSYRGKSKTFQGEEFEYFGANDGRVVCVSNYGSALLDLPFESADADPQGFQLGYRARTEVLPPRGTKVRVLFEGKK